MKQMQITWSSRTWSHRKINQSWAPFPGESYHCSHALWGFVWGGFKSHYSPCKIFSPLPTTCMVPEITSPPPSLTLGRIFNVRGHNLISETARERWLCSLYHLLRAHYVLSTKYFTYISFLNHYSNLRMQRLFIAPCYSSENWGLERLSHLNNWEGIQKRRKSRCLSVEPLLFLYLPVPFWQYVLRYEGESARAPKNRDTKKGGEEASGRKENEPYICWFTGGRTLLPAGWKS